MLVSEIYSEIRQEANTNATKCSDSFLLTGVNLDYGELVMQALRSRGDFNFSMEEATTDLISTVGLVAGNNGYNGEYAWPSDLIKPVRTEVSFDGTTWNKAKIYDISDAENNSEHLQSSINNTFTSSEPYVRFERNSFFVRPLKDTAGNITSGIHIWYEKRQATLTASDTPVIEPNFHRLLVLRGAHRIMRKFWNEYPMNRRQEVDLQIQKLEAEFRNFYSNQIQENSFLSVAEDNFA